MISVFDRASIYFVLKALRGSQKPGSKYFRRVPTGNPDRPYHYYYTEESFSRAHADKETEKKTAQGAKANMPALVRSLRDAFREIMRTPDLPDPVPRAGRWQESVPGMPAETVHTFKNGLPGPARKRLHQHIENHFLEGKTPVPAGQKPVAILMMGGPASGKSTMVRASGMDLDSFVVADADAVKSMIPEYRVAVANRARNAARMAHEESSRLVKDIRAKAISQRMNLVIDGTGSKTASYEQAIESLRAQGYRIKLLMADVPPEVGLRRARRRANKTGRYVPPEFIAQAYPAIPGGFEKIKSLVDEAAVYDTHIKPGMTPEIIYEKSGSTEQIHNRRKHAKMQKRLQKSLIFLIVKSMSQRLDESGAPQSHVRSDKELIEAILDDDWDFSDEELRRIDALPDLADYDEGEGIAEVLDEDDSFL